MQLNGKTLSTHWFWFAGIVMVLIKVGYLQNDLEQASAAIKDIKAQHSEVTAAKVDQLTTDVAYIRQRVDELSRSK
jgi:hypothetical protein